MINKYFMKGLNWQFKISNIDKTLTDYQINKYIN